MPKAGLNPVRKVKINGKTRYYNTHDVRKTPNPKALELPDLGKEVESKTPQEKLADRIRSSRIRLD